MGKIRQIILENKINKRGFVLLLFCFTLLTFLRGFMIPLYFSIPLLLFFIIPYKINANFFLLLFTVFISIMVLVVTGEELLWPNFILSMYIILTTLLLFLCNPIPKNINSANGKLIFPFIKFASYFMIFNNCLGLLEYIIFPVFPVTALRDDSFIGIYGTHGIGAHGMSLVNGLLFLYYFSKYRNDKAKYSLGMLLFFLVSFLGALYGMGLVIMIVTMISYYLIIKRSIKLMIGVILTVVLIYGFMSIIAPVSLRYNMRNITGFIDGFNELDKKPVADKTSVPRKLLTYYNYYKHYTNDAKLFLIGTGPGTFNSRTSFLLNGDYSPGNPFEKAFGIHEPKLAKKYIYPLWERKEVLKAYNDGTRNQPFSSVISLLAEYGVVFFIIFSFVTFKKIKYIVKRLNTENADKNARILKDFLMLSGLFVLLNLWADNLMEFTEMMVFILLIKFVEVYSIYIHNKQSHAGIANT